MQLPPLTRQQVRSVDQIAMERYEIAGVVLMENAGRGAAEVIDQITDEGPIVILCGSGNNAGDGYVIARHLQVLGHVVRVLSLVDSDSLSGDARTNARIAQKSKIEIRRVESRTQISQGLANAAVVVDALLGTGAKGAPRGLFADAVVEANQSEATRVAIDLPTGLDCDTGFLNDPTFRADQTLTFVSEKVGFKKGNADTVVGVVSVIGIGIPSELIEEIRTW